MRKHNCSGQCAGHDEDFRLLLVMVLLLLLDINMNRNESSFTSGTRAQPLSRHVITPLIIVIIIIIIIIIIIVKFYVAILPLGQKQHA